MGLIILSWLFSDILPFKNLVTKNSIDRINRKKARNELSNKGMSVEAVHREGSEATILNFVNERNVALTFKCSCQGTKFIEDTSHTPDISSMVVGLTM